MKITDQHITLAVFAVFGVLLLISLGHVTSARDKERFEVQHDQAMQQMMRQHQTLHQNQVKLQTNLSALKTENAKLKNIVAKQPPRK